MIGWLRSLSHHTRTLYGGLVLGTIVTLIMLLFVQNLSIFSRAELTAYDAQFTRRGDMAQPKGVVVVGVDQPSISFLDSNLFPPKRVHYADAVNFLTKAGARAIGIDFEFFSDSHYGAKDDAAVAKAFKKNGKVACVQALNTTPATNNLSASVSLTPPIDTIANACKALGVANVPEDADGAVRASDLLQYGPNNKFYPALALQVASIALHKPASEVAKGLPDHMLVNFVGKQDPGDASAQTFRTTQFASVADAEDDPSLYKDKIVLIVPDAIPFGDLHTTPYGAMYGGFIQANTVNTIMERNYINPAGDLANDLILLIVGLLTTLVAVRLGIIRSAVSTLVLLVGFAAFSALLFSVLRIWINLVAPEATIIVVFAAIMGLRFATEERQRRKAVKSFGNYVAPQVVDIIVNSPDANGTLAGARRDISVLFVDVRGFTAMSERMEPENVVKALDIYLEELTQSVLQYGGMIDKYVGDEIMAVWNIPFEQADHPMLAVKSGLDMVERMDKVNEQLRGLSLPAIRYGIGINSGEAVVGEMGSSLRKQYDVIGDAVNTGARLCSAAGGGEVIIGQVTWESIGDRLVVEETEPLRLKGKSQPLRTFSVLSVKEAGSEPVPTPSQTAEPVG